MRQAFGADTHCTSYQIRRTVELERSMDSTEIRKVVTEAHGSLADIVSVDSSICQLELVDALGALNELKAHVSDIELLIKTEIANGSVDGDRLKSGDFAVAVDQKVKLTTDWSKLLPELLGQISEDRRVNEDTGEVETVEEAICRHLPSTLPMTGSVRPKRAGLQALDVDPVPFQERIEGGLAVSIKAISQPASIAA